MIQTKQSMVFIQRNGTKNKMDLGIINIANGQTINSIGNLCWVEKLKNESYHLSRIYEISEKSITVLDLIDDKRYIVSRDKIIPYDMYSVMDVRVSAPDFIKEAYMRQFPTPNKVEPKTITWFQQWLIMRTGRQGAVLILSLRDMFLFVLNFVLWSIAGYYVVKYPHLPALLVVLIVGTFVLGLILWVIKQALSFGYFAMTYKYNTELPEQDKKKEEKEEKNAA